jgi:outer membrane lipoprotein-sorting protein
LRKAAFLALMIALCLSLFACGGKSGTDGLAEEIKKEYSETENMTLIISVRADYGSRVYDYKLRCEVKDDEMDIEVIEPEGIKGLKAHVSEEGIGLEYEGTTLDTGELFGKGLSPIEAIPIMLNAWKSGYITETRNEKIKKTETIAVTFDLKPADSEKDLLHTVWFDKESHLPVKAELLYGGYRVIDCEFGNVILE